jgi:uncharacterized membrane protein
MADRFTKTIIVKADVRTAFNQWANFENFPHFMKYIERVEKTGPRTSKWTVAGPLGATVEWEAETTRMDPDTRIGWNTKGREGITTSGEVVFADLGNGSTQLNVTFQYDAPAGVVGDVVGKIFANPEGRVEEDLKNFKEYVESMGSMSGMRGIH